MPIPHFISCSATQFSDQQPFDTDISFLPRLCLVLATYLDTAFNELLNN